MMRLFVSIVPTGVQLFESPKSELIDPFQIRHVVLNAQLTLLRLSLEVMG